MQTKVGIREGMTLAIHVLENLYEEKQENVGVYNYNMLIRVIRIQAP